MGVDELFGSHKRQGATAGVVIRNTFSSVSLKTSLHSFETGFRPTLRFICDGYTLGFFIKYSTLIRIYHHNGASWAPRKTADYVFAAFDAFQGNERLVDAERLMVEVDHIRSESSYNIGQTDAETCFGAISGLLKQSDSDPVVIRASCSIPDDHIAPRRSALFMARSVLNEVRNGRSAC
jgi:hypothetical protein